jgi:Fic family protein
MLGTVFGQSMKASRVADQIDAQVTSGKNLIVNAKVTAQQFDLVENTLKQIASLIASSGDTMASLQFENLQQQINNIQMQIVNSLNQIETVFANIDSLTDKIQN